MMTTTAYFRNNQILFASLASGQLLFMIIGYLFSFDISNNETLLSLDEILRIVVPVFSLSGVAGSLFLFNKKTQQIIQISSLVKKLKEYRSALIIRYALIEAPVMFAIIAHFITGSEIFIVMAAVLFTYFIFLFPNKIRLKRDLRLDYQEAINMDDPDFVISD